MDDDLLYVDPLPATPPSRPRKRSLKKAAACQSQSQSQSQHRHHHQAAALGAAAGAEVVTGAFVESRHPLKGKLMLTCAAVGVGALYLGLLFYLYKKIAALENSLHNSLEEIKDLLDQSVVDEPACNSNNNNNRNPPGSVPGSVSVQQQPPPSLPPMPPHPMDTLAETLASFHIVSASAAAEADNDIDTKAKTKTKTKTQTNTKTKTDTTTDTTEDEDEDEDETPEEVDPPKVEELGSWPSTTSMTMAPVRPPSRKGKKPPPAPVVDLDAM